MKALRFTWAITASIFIGALSFFGWLYQPEKTWEFVKRTYNNIMNEA